MNIIPDDAIVYTCEHMKITELEQFIKTTQKNYELCVNILEERINSPEFQQQLQLYEKKLRILNHITPLLNNLRQGQVLDLSTYNGNTGKCIKIISTPGINSRLRKLDRQIYTYPGNYDLLLEILSVENPYDIY